MSEIRANTISAANGTDPATLTKQACLKCFYTTTGVYDSSPAGTSLNVSSISDDGTGISTATYVSNFTDLNYAVTASVDSSNGKMADYSGETTSTCTIQVHTHAGVDANNNIGVQIVGDLA